MIRLIKRYGSRKLYDTEESRYVGLDEIATWIRNGQEVRVVDNKTTEDATAATLAQIISEEGRRGGNTLTSDLLHQIIRMGEQAVTSGMEQVQMRIDRLVQSSVERLKPIRRARDEMSELRTRLEELEAALGEIEADSGLPRAAGVSGSPAAERGGSLKVRSETRTAAKRQGKRTAAGKKKGAAV